MFMNPRSCEKYFTYPRSTSLFSFVFLSTKTNLTSPFLNTTLFTLTLPQSQLSHSVPSSSLVAVETVAGECQLGRRWGLGCCPISLQRPAHWVVLWSLTSGGGCVCVCGGGELQRGRQELLCNPSL